MPWLAYLIDIRGPQFPKNKPTLLLQYHPDISAYYVVLVSFIGIYYLHNGWLVNLLVNPMAVSGRVSSPDKKKKNQVKPQVRRGSLGGIYVGTKTRRLPGTNSSESGNESIPNPDDLLF